MALIVLKFVRNHVLTCLILFSVLLAMLSGVLVRRVKKDWTPRQLMYIAFPGEIFLQMLQSVIIPLITTSLIIVVASLDIRKSKKIGGLSIAYSLLSTLVAIQVGLLLVIIIKPGSYQPDERVLWAAEGVNQQPPIADIFLDLFRNCFPPNWVQATMFQYRTLLIPPEICEEGNCTDISTWEISYNYVEGLNIAGLVFVSVCVGAAAAMLGQRTEVFKSVVLEVHMITMKITGWIIWLSPVCVFFLVFSKFIGSDMLLVQQLGLLILTIILGMIIHATVVLPAASFLLTRKNPDRFIANMSEALAMAFGTASSSAALPLTLRCCEEKNGIHPQIVGFVIPIGATINMNGTALYEAVAAVFISQMRGKHLNFGHYLLISITATAASVGAAGIPNAGLVTMVMILDAVGLPPEDISLVIALDWLLDRLRTTVNVLGDAFGAQVIGHLCRNEFEYYE